MAAKNQLVHFECSPVKFLYSVTHFVCSAGVFLGTSSSESLLLSSELDFSTFFAGVSSFLAGAGVVFLGSSSSESLLSSELDFSTFFAGVSAFLAGAGVVFVPEALGVFSSSLLDSSELESALKFF